MALGLIAGLSGCEGSAPTKSDIEKAVDESLTQYAREKFAFKSFNQTSSKKGREGAVDVTYYTGNATITAKVDGIIGSADYHGDGTRHSWNKYPQSFMSQIDLAKQDDAIKQTWSAGHPVKAGTEIEVTNVTIGCWSGKAEGETESRWHCDRPKND